MVLLLPCWLWVGGLVLVCCFILFVLISFGVCLVLGGFDLLACGLGVVVLFVFYFVFGCLVWGC